VSVLDVDKPHPLHQTQQYQWNGFAARTPNQEGQRVNATAVFPEFGWRNESPKRHTIALADDLELHRMVNARLA
jgi:hypothetical protein